MEPTEEELAYLNSSEFELEGIKYKAVNVNNQDAEIPTCVGCAFDCAFDGHSIRKCMAAPQCAGIHRTDGREVIFVKVEEDAKN